MLRIKMLLKRSLGRMFKRRRREAAAKRWSQAWQDVAHGEAPKPAWRQPEPEPEIRAAVEGGFFLEGSRILDVGCGAGELSCWLARQGFDVSGVDVADAAVGLAQDAGRC